MKLHGIEFEIKNLPELDKEFIPIGAYVRAFEKSAQGKTPIAICVERSNGQIARLDAYIHGDDNMLEADKLYVERTVKMSLWRCGGWKVYICGCERIGEYIKSLYQPGGKRDFDYGFMSGVYEKTFEVVVLPLEEAPQSNESSSPVGRHLDGCRIGFDAGGSDRKVSAVIDGESVYSEEVVWFPKTTEDPDYHYNGILEAFKTAASKMPRVDAIGVSSAGIYVDNRAMAASLFLKVPKDKFDEKVKDIYIRAAKEIGDVPLLVANDGDVSALAGAMGLEDNSVLGIAMGTSEATGYVDEEGNIKGWLNELAFAPVDLSEKAMVDEWSGDIGCGVKYFSQDSVIKLSPAAGIELDESLSPAEKLKVVQEAMKNGSDAAKKIYYSIGVYLGHTLAYYYMYYKMRHVLLFGRAVSGEGGNIVVEEAKRVLSEEYPEYASIINLSLPDEKTRRVGQSAAAASLPKIEK